MSASSKVTVATLASLKAREEPATFVTAYDYPTATFADRAGIDMLLVGDSAANTMLGLTSTVGITMTEMLVFAGAVCRGAQRAFVVGDLPFLSYQPSNASAVRNAGAFIAAGCDAVKCEGGRRSAPRVRAIADAGIAVMGHIGLTPQAVGQQGGYRVQGKTPAAVTTLVEDAIALVEAGAFAILLEAVPPEAASTVRERLAHYTPSVPVYGIGAGPHVDGQLLICHDLLGSFVGSIRPRFAKQFAEVGAVTEEAFRSYAREVRAGVFPGPEHCYAGAPALEIGVAS